MIEFLYELFLLGTANLGLLPLDQDALENIYFLMPLSYFLVYKYVLLFKMQLLFVHRDFYRQDFFKKIIIIYFF